MKTNNLKSIKNIKEYIVFDLETTGISVASEILEFSFLKYKNDILIEKLTAVVKPKIFPNQFILDLTKISRVEINNALTIDSYKTQIENFIDGFVLIAHNAPFDIRFLNQILKQNINIYVIDTLFWSRLYLKNLKNHKLETIKNYFNISISSHRSTNDCLITKELFCYLRDCF